MKKLSKSTLSLRKEAIVVLNQNQLKKIFGGDPIEGGGPNDDTLGSAGSEVNPTVICPTEEGTLQATTRNSKTGQYSETDEGCY